jgi:hypothetical protein
MDRDKQARYEEIHRKFDADTATSEEIIEGVRLYAELYPEEQWWDDDRTPAEIWPLLKQKEGSR